MIEGSKLINPFPNTFIRRMENMRTIGMHINAVHFLSMAISANMIPLLQNKAFETPVC